ncbi:uncharacterized protein LOC110016926 [Oryzias latipes]
MSNTPVQDPPAQGGSSDSGHTLPSRPLLPVNDASASKRVCFYKSGDYQFTGHRMIITSRTFKTFDALLDALSKKVPLPFGVRTITTPRGTRLVKALDDLQDGGAYVCSDQKRVKPLNLDEVTRRQVPWNTTRVLSSERRRRQGLRSGLPGRGNNDSGRPAKVTERAAVRTPRKLVVIKNKDPSVKRTIVLQRRTAPTFDTLLDYLSQILQFPVLKLYSTDGRRVDGLAALILCSGVVVAAGKEAFKLGGFRFQRTSQAAQVLYVETVEPATQQAKIQKKKSLTSGRGSKNFSLSSERYIINQIQNSRNGGVNGFQRRHGSDETEAHQCPTPVETCQKDAEHPSCIIPHEDDIEKSFRVNQDGSMTVEMKVHLTIKEEEMLHWTTTVSRSSLSRRKVCASASESGNSSPDSNHTVAKDSSNIQEDETKEENYQGGAGRGVGFAGDASAALGKAKASFKRTSTPGPRRVNKKTSVESVKMVTENSFQESMMGHYSYMERTADGETTEGYCVVRHSSSNKPIPKPRKTASAGGRNPPTSIRSSGGSEVPRVPNDVTETVMHIYETQSCYDNYLANEEYSADGASLHESPLESEGKPSPDSRSLSSNNDCDIDCNWQPPTSDSLLRQKEEMLSLSSEPECLTHQAPNNAEIQAQAEDLEENPAKSTKKKTVGSSTSTSSTDKKLNRRTMSPSKRSKRSSPDKGSSDASAGRKSLNSVETLKNGLKNKTAETPHSTKSVQQKRPTKESTASPSSGNLRRTSSKSPSTKKPPAKENGHNIDTPTARPQMKKKMSDILETKKAFSGKKSLSKPKSMIEYKLSAPKSSSQQSECSSRPSLNPSPSEVHQYVENWLENVSPDQVPCAEEAAGPEPHAKVIFKIGADSESDETNESQAVFQDSLKKSSSCLSVPLSHEGAALLHGERRTLGLCVSMPSIRAEPANQENRLRSHKSADVIGPDGSEASSSHLLSPKEKIKPVLRQLCSSIQCIRRSSTSNSTPALHTSSSTPNFSTQVASVFGSSCKAFLSFLSVMTLRENLTGSAAGESKPSEAPEALLMLESLQHISNIEDEEEQRASLTDLQSTASSHLRERWKDFQILRERLESEPLSPKISETEFALDVVSEGGDIFEDQHQAIDELMEEMHMPEDLREQISSTIKSFYPVEESTYVETVKNQSDSEEDVEMFVSESKEEVQRLTEVSEDLTEATKEGMERKDEAEKHQSECEGKENVEKDECSSEADAEEEEWEEREDEEEEKDTGGRNDQQVNQTRESDQTSVEKLEEEEPEDEEIPGEEETREEFKEEESLGTDKEIANEETGNSDRTEDTDEREGAVETAEEEEEERNSGGEDHEDVQEGQEEEEEANGEELGSIDEDVDKEKEKENKADAVEERVEEEEDTEEVDEGHTEEEEKGQFSEVVSEETSEENEKEERKYTEKVLEEEKHDEGEGGMEGVEEEEMDDNLEAEEDTTSEQSEDEEERNSNEDEEENESLRQLDHQPKDQTKEEEDPLSSAENDEDTSELKDASGLKQSRSNVEEGLAENMTESPTNFSTDGQVEDDKVVESVHETDKEGGEERKSSSSSHPVEISQDLLDFVNYALRSCSLRFTCDAQGNIRIEPENARVVQTKQSTTHTGEKEGLKCLPSPFTSDLSDYRPETSESGGYKSQGSVDIASESGGEAPKKSSLVSSRSANGEETNVEQTRSKVSVPSSSEALNSSSLKSTGSLSPGDADTKALREDLSYFSAASSLKEDAEVVVRSAQTACVTSDKDSADGVLIDRGRWLLKENHLIRKSPPLSMGMYGNLDSTSVDTGQDNTSEDSPPHYSKSQHSPLAVISSSDLEEMAKPGALSCKYYNLPHGSDSDPFLDDAGSIHSGRLDASVVKGRGFRVSPTVDTTKTWANRNGSLSSFASVELKIPDRKVHPEESSAAMQPRGTSSGEQGALQPQDSVDSLHLRCGQYCPIL